MSFLTSSLSLPGHRFEPFPRVLSLNATEKTGYLPEITALQATQHASVHSHHVCTHAASTSVLRGLCFNATCRDDTATWRLKAM